MHNVVESPAHNEYQSHDEHHHSHLLYRSLGLVLQVPSVRCLHQVVEELYIANGHCYDRQHKSYHHIKVSQEPHVVDMPSITRHVYQYCTPGVM